MADLGAQDRHLPASELKIRKAREEGQLARSRDLGHLAVAGGGGVALLLGAPAIGRWTESLLTQGLRFDARMLQHPSMMAERLAEIGLQAAALLAVMGAVTVILALIGGLGSGGWNWSWKALQPKFSKLNPINGVGQLFSGQQLAVTLKSCLLALLLGAIGAAFVHAQFDVFVGLLAQDLPNGLQQALSTTTAGLGLLLIALVCFALVDVPLQRFLLARRLRMTLREVKDENKDVEGNPEVKTQLRYRMRQMSRRRMMAAVPGADLIVMNPTHYAVALKYDEATMEAPRVVAKGADALALRIRDLAREHGVPVLQAPPLARALYAHAELDREIPARLFTAVAQVLAWVYQWRAAEARRQPAPPAPAGDALPVPADLDPHRSAEGATP